MTKDAIGALLRAIIHCPTGDALRYPAGRSLLARLTSGERRAPRASADPIPDGPWGLIVVGPGVRLTEDQGCLLSQAEGGPVVDFSERGAKKADPRRRSLDEDWFTLARSATETALTAITDGLSPGPAALVHQHRGALALRLKTDIALRLRRLDLVSKALTLHAGRVLLIEGDQALDDMEIAGLAQGRTIVRVCAPTSHCAWRRQDQRRSGQSVAASDDAGALLAAIKRWTPRIGGLKGRVVVAADLRNVKDFRHSGAATALLREVAARPDLDAAVLIQPRTRLTKNVARAVRASRRHGGQVRLVRQPQFTGAAPDMAALRASLLTRIDAALPSSVDASRRAAVLEAAGGFIISSLGPSLALAKAMETAVRRSRPAAVISVPLGSPFGALLVSAARAGGAPTMEVQTLMIGVSDRDPPPVAERLAVLDTEQKAIFARRFDVSEDRFVVAGRVDPAVTLAALPRVGQGKADVLFASQPLDAICIAAARLLAEACRRQGVRLDIAPHPDETDQDLDAYRAVLADHPGLEGAVLERGCATRAMATHRVLGTVVSNMALWAAAQGRDVITVDVGVPLPLDFAAMGVALKARTIEEIAATLEDLRGDGPLSEQLKLSRDAYFARNPQLRRGDGAAMIINALLA